MKSRTSTILEHWMDFRLKLFVEGIFIGLAAGIVIVLYRVILEHAELIRSQIYILIGVKPQWAFLWFVILIAIAFILGQIIRKEPLVSGSGIPQVKGQLASRLKVKWLNIIIGKFLGGILAIGAGLSLGREGPSIQLGAAVGQGTGYTLGRLRLENKYLITCGASAGLAAAFNAPLAGVIFSLEEMHKNFSPTVLLSAMAASLTADFISLNVFGQKPIFNFQSLPILPLDHYFYLILLGIVIGLFGVFFNISLNKTLDIYERLKIPTIYRPLFPLIVAGVLGFVLPQTLGGGHHLVNSLATQDTAMNMLIILVTVKFLFTMISYGSGVPGGIFLPLLVIAALSGNIFGQLATQFFHIDPQLINNFIVLSMAAYFTAIVKAPITGSILITEMTGSLSHLLPISIVSLTAYLVADILHSKPIYDLLLERLLLKKGSLEFIGKEHRKVIIETAVCLGSRLDQKRIKNIKWPQDCLLVGIIRGEKEIIPQGNTLIQVGDYIIALTNEDQEAKIKEDLLLLAGEYTY